MAAVAAAPAVATRPRPKFDPPMIDPQLTVEERTLDVAVPTGAVASLRIHVRDDEITVVPELRRGVLVQRVFMLQSPPRLVIDLGGREPKYSWQLDGSVFKQVRVGARNHGTRVVVDLDENQKVRVLTPAGV
jgi:hypothetical protein